MGTDLYDMVIDSTNLTAFFDDFRKLIELQTDTPRPAYHFDYSQFEGFLADFAERYRSKLRSGDMIDPWTIAGLGSDEVRNSAVLAWLFDENGSHGREGKFLRAFLAHANVGSLISDESVQNYRVYTEKYSLGDRQNRVDLVIEGEAFVLFIEVKIYASEGPEQVRKYCGILKERAALTASNRFDDVARPPTAKQHALLYLTPWGGMPNITDDERELVRPARWRDVSQVIRNVLSQESRDIGNTSDFLLEKLAAYFHRF